MTALHITNGDGAADTLKASGVEGDVLVWRDPMHHGPFPPHLDLDAASELRAHYLAGAAGSYEETARDFQLRNSHLRAAPRYSEVTLWFEHDLLDQLQILQLLDWLAGTDLRATRLSMICIGSFPGIDPFRGLGQLTAAQLGSLYAKRRPIVEAQLGLAVVGWEAFRAPSPARLEAFLTADLTPLPFLRAALARHLEEFPWTLDGLTRTERQLLELVRRGVCGPGQLFAANMERETVLFEGDWRTFEHIADLCNARTPLLRCEPNGTFRYPPVGQISRAEFRQQRLALTAEGDDVLGARLNASPLMDRDEWLGGVHLSSSQPMWMWELRPRSMRSTVIELMIDLPNLDPVLHQPARTRLAIILSRGPVSFSQLKAGLRITDGNLDAHLRKFSAAGYLHSKMVVEGRPRTDYSLSASGAKALTSYLRNLNCLIKAAPRSFKP